MGGVTCPPNYVIGPLGDQIVAWVAIAITPIVFWLVWKYAS